MIFAMSAPRDGLVPHGEALLEAGREDDWKQAAAVANGTGRDEVQVSVEAVDSGVPSLWRFNVAPMMDWSDDARSAL